MANKWRTVLMSIFIDSLETLNVILNWAIWPIERQASTKCREWIGSVRRDSNLPPFSLTSSVYFCRHLILHKSTKSNCRSTYSCTILFNSFLLSCCCCCCHRTSWILQLDTNRRISCSAALLSFNIRLHLQRQQVSTVNSARLLSLEIDIQQMGPRIMAEELC